MNKVRENPVESKVKMTVPFGVISNKNVIEQVKKILISPISHHKTSNTKIDFVLLLCDNYISNCTLKI